MNTTPEYIVKLEPNEIFVFGSNLRGSHGGGAALLAYQKFGAKWNISEGLTGQSYAIPTMDAQIIPLSINQIKIHVDKFILFAKANPQFTFLVTAIGTGICGYSTEQIAPLFNEAIFYNNIYLPNTFIQIIKTH